MHYCLVFFPARPDHLRHLYARLVSPDVRSALGSEARARGFATNLAATFWLWFVLGSLIFVGPFVYTPRCARQ